MNLQKVNGRYITQVAKRWGSNVNLSSSKQLGMWSQNDLIPPKKQCERCNGLLRRRILWHFLILEGVAVLLATSFRASAGETSRGLQLTFGLFLAMLLPVVFMCKSRNIFCFQFYKWWICAFWSESVHFRVMRSGVRRQWLHGWQAPRTIDFRRPVTGADSRIKYGPWDHIPYCNEYIVLYYEFEIVLLRFPVVDIAETINKMLWFKKKPFG